MAYMDWDPQSGEHLAVLAFSADGVHWETSDIRWHPGFSDTNNNLFYNPITGRYQIMCRKVWVDRRIAVVESEDLKTWTPPRVIIHPDPLDPPCVQLYGMATFYYEGIFIGFLQLFHADMSERRSPIMAGPMEAELAYSYDGLSWNRTHRRFIAPPPLGEYLAIPGHMMVDPEGRIRIYSAGGRQEHHRPHGAGSAISLHTLRKDGFVCLESMGTSGYVRTKALILDGPNLSFNIKAPLGKVSIQVSEVVDRDCRPIPGYMFEDFEPWTGDEVALRPQWQGGKDVAGLVGRRIQFELRMEQAQLYAVRGQLRPGHALAEMQWYG
jgi:hypothetical protein